jgi:arsenate reductase
MAEGWLRHDLADGVEVHSAGTRPSHVHPLAVRAMAEAGVDISGHRSKSASEFAGQTFDLVVTVCDAAREACPMFPGAARQVHESIPDPALAGSQGDAALERFRFVRDLIRETIVPLVRRELGP